MPKMHKTLILLFAAAACPWGAHSAAPAPGWLERGLKARLEKFASTPDDSARTVSTRDLTNAALLNLMTGGDPARSEAWIARAYATQDMDPASKTFGELKWNTGDAAITDRNAIEFGTQAIGPLYLNYAGRLSAAFKKSMQSHLAAALAGLHGHNVPVSYTNIFLMNLVSGMLIGQATGDAAAVRQAEQELDAWIEYTRTHGVHEFDSPTYYAVDLDDLVEGYRYAADAGDRRKFERALDYFWTDIAASYFPGGQRVAGPYSRDYDFLRGHGGMDVWLNDAGWSEISSPAIDFEKVFVLDNQRAGGYRVRPEALALSRQAPREVVSAWDDDPHHQRFLWVGKEVALGCTSGDYNAQDKLFSATFAGPPDLPQISIVPDIFDAPYGLVRNPDRSGHMKPTHLPLHAACVARGGTALVTLDLDPSAVPDSARGFATNILLPEAAAVEVEGKRQPLSPGARVPLATSAVISARMGSATVAIRLLHVDSLPEENPDYALLADATGAAKDALRLKLAHLDPGRQTKAKHLRVAFLISATDDLKTVQITSELRDHVWTVRAKLPKLTLELARSADDRKTIVRQLVNGEAAPGGILSVNGREIMR